MVYSVYMSRTFTYTPTEQDALTRKVTQRDTAKTLLVMVLLLIAQYIVYARLDTIKNFFR